MNTDIYLSYASEDAANARELSRVLQDEGWSVWWDRKISIGSDVEVDSATALAKARAVVVLWSTFSVASNRVKNEAREAKESNRLIPVLLEDARIPLSYRSLAAVDLRQWPEKPAPLEISKFKSIIARVLNTGVPGQKRKLPLMNDGLSLSVRVANQMVIGRKRGDADSVAPDISLAIERCISDIFLDILKTLPNTVESNLDTYMLQLAMCLQPQAVVCNKVDFSRMSVSDIRSITPGKVTATQEKAILEQVNQHCSPEGEHNLRLEPDKWPVGKMLCLPLAQYAGGREFAWFIAKTTNGQWTPAIQEQMLRLASGIQAGVALAY
ncbi:MAG: toll/interleukin-1 receptor domain-containing protein [Halioglobus sp.]